MAELNLDYEEMVSLVNSHQSPSKIFGKIGWVSYPSKFFNKGLHDQITLSNSILTMYLVETLIVYTGLKESVYIFFLFILSLLLISIYITNLVCYTYYHWFFSPECQHIFGKQTGYIFQFPKTIKTWTTKHYASLNQWYNTE